MRGGRANCPPIAKTHSGFASLRTEGLFPLIAFPQDC